MSWASNYIDKLNDGQTVKFRPHGNSMSGKVESGELCTVAPIEDDIEVGDIVLCKVKGKQYLHLVSAIQGKRYQISNNKGFVNGWIRENAIYGKLTNVEK